VILPLAGVFVTSVKLNAMLYLIKSFGFDGENAWGDKLPFDIAKTTKGSVLPDLKFPVVIEPPVLL